MVDGLSDKSLTPLLILNPTIIDTRAEPCGEGTDGDIASHSLLKHRYRLLALRSMLVEGQEDRLKGLQVIEHVIDHIAYIPIVPSQHVGDCYAIHPP